MQYWTFSVGGHLSAVGRDANASKHAAQESVKHREINLHSQQRRPLGCRCPSRYVAAAFRLAAVPCLAVTSRRLLGSPTPERQLARPSGRCVTSIVQLDPRKPPTLYRTHPIPQNRSNVRPHTHRSSPRRSTRPLLGRAAHYPALAGAP